jgi:hypothetical protein
MKNRDRKRNRRKRVKLAGFPAMIAAWLVVATVSGAQVGQSASRKQGGLVGQPAIAPAIQHPLESSLHQRAMDAGGTWKDSRELDPRGLASDLAALAAKSEEIVLGHVVRARGLLDPTGESVVTEYDVLVLRSWKGRYKGGSIMKVAVPAGSYRFRDAVRAQSLVKGFSGLVDGGRYVFFLVTAGGQLVPDDSALALAGEGIQGAFLLQDEKVSSVYQQDAGYYKRDVPGYFTELDVLSGLQR